MPETDTTTTTTMESRADQIKKSAMILLRMDPIRIIVVMYIYLIVSLIGDSVIWSQTFYLIMELLLLVSVALLPTNRRSVLDNFDLISETIAFSAGGALVLRFIFKQMFSSFTLVALIFLDVLVGVFVLFKMATVIELRKKFI